MRCLLVISAGVYCQPPFAQHVVERARSSLAPRFSDVVFSPRFLRPESFDVGRAFGATRAEWIYVPNRDDAVRQLKRLPDWVGLTLNSTPVLPNGLGYAQDFDGTPLVAPWMKSWGAKWVTTTHPETRDVLRLQLEQSLGAGAKSIQFDGPLLQVYSAIFHAGEFNDATQEGFAAWLRRHPDRRAVEAAGLHDLGGTYRTFLIENHGVVDASDYKRRFQSFASSPLWQDYIRSTVTDYFSGLRLHLDRHDPAPVALSMNVSMLWPDARFHSFFLTAFPDYLMAETEIDDTANLISQVATARALELGFVPSIRPLGLARNRAAIAMLYAMGSQPIVPWDVFIPDKQRYFGTPEEYGDLYRLVRERPDLFEDHDALALVAIIIDPKRFSLPEIRKLTTRLAEAQIPYAFVLTNDAKGPRPLTTGRLAGFSLIVNATPTGTMSQNDRDALGRSKALIREISSVEPSLIDQLRPFIVSEPQRPHLFVRKRSTATKPSWVVHVVNEGAPADSDLSWQACPRRIGFQPATQLLPEHFSATWIALNRQVPLQVTHAEDGTPYVTLPECRTWALIAIEQARPH